MQACPAKLENPSGDIINIGFSFAGPARKENQVLKLPIHYNVDFVRKLYLIIADMLCCPDNSQFYFSKRLFFPQ